MEILVRDACAADMLAVRSVMSEATAQLRRVYRPSPTAVARAKASQDVCWLVATVDGEAVGALRYVAEADRLHLGLGVIPEFQHKGVGRAMVESLAEKAASLGLAKLSLFTVRETGNVPLFEHLGFQVMREEPAQDLESATGSPLSEVYMERTLS